MSDISMHLYLYLSFRVYTDIHAYKNTHTSTLCTITLSHASLPVVLLCFSSLHSPGNFLQRVCSRRCHPVLHFRKTEASQYHCSGLDTRARSLQEEHGVLDSSERILYFLLCGASVSIQWFCAKNENLECDVFILYTMP